MSNEGGDDHVGKDLELIYGHKRTDIPGIIAHAGKPVVFLGLDTAMMEDISAMGVLVWDSEKVKIILTAMRDDEDYATMSRTWASQLEKVDRLTKLPPLKEDDDGET